MKDCSRHGILEVNAIARLSTSFISFLVSDVFQIPMTYLNTAVSKEKLRDEQV
jgi:hypothetical protein